MQSQIIAFVSFVFPIILLFSYLDYKDGSIGKRKMGLKLVYKNKNYSSALIRNTIKFLLWQLEYMVTIREMYIGINIISIVMEVLSVGLMLLLFFMDTKRNDKRHLGYLIAGTQIFVEK